LQIILSVPWCCPTRFSYIFQSFVPVSQEFLNRTVSMAHRISLVMNSITKS
jgi:hypothetical protein